MEHIQKRGLIIWVYSFKNLSQLNRFGNVHYISKRMNYVSLYVNEINHEQTMEKIKRLHFVRSVEKSYLPDIDMDFEHALDSERGGEQGTG